MRIGKIKSVSLKTTETGVVDIPFEGVTLFVGPNNSGKSLAIREMHHELTLTQKMEGRKIFHEYNIDWPSQDEFVSYLEECERSGLLEGAPCGTYFLKRREAGRINRQQANTGDLKYWFDNKMLHPFNSVVHGSDLLLLDGRTRFDLVNDQAMNDLLLPPANLLQLTFQNDGLRQKIRREIRIGLERYFVVDPTAAGSLRIRLSSEPPGNDERSLSASACMYYAAAPYIREWSDGVQAYVGVIFAMLAGGLRGVFVDEPEAFLHPPLARRLGAQIARLSREENFAVFAATHSADFLQGCLSGGVPVQVVRLEHRDGKSRATVIESAALEILVQHPLVRNANVLSALFYDGVVITESDNDRVFYSEIYNRLLASDPALPSILFVNSQNKQTVKQIVAPLRKFGVPAVGIVDIDVIKDGGEVWTGWMESIGVPPALLVGYAAQRAAILKAFENTGKDMKKDGGINCLVDADRRAAQLMFAQLEQFGMFVVPSGELESWLKHLGVSGRKTEWAVSMLSRLGSRPEDPEYVRPEIGDVWDFLRRIAAWIALATRSGVA